jgi:hypothetical protein
MSPTAAYYVIVNEKNEDRTDIANYAHGPYETTDDAEAALLSTVEEYSTASYLAMKNKLSNRVTGSMLNSGIQISHKRIHDEKHSYISIVIAIDKAASLSKDDTDSSGWLIIKGSSKLSTLNGGKDILLGNRSDDEDCNTIIYGHSINVEATCSYYTNALAKLQEILPSFIFVSVFPGLMQQFNSTQSFRTSFIKDNIQHDFGMVEIRKRIDWIYYINCRVWSDENSEKVATSKLWGPYRTRSEADEQASHMNHVLLDERAVQPHGGTSTSWDNLPQTSAMKIRRLLRGRNVEISLIKERNSKIKAALPCEVYALFRRQECDPCMQLAYTFHASENVIQVGRSFLEDMLEDNVIRFQTRPKVLGDKGAIIFEARTAIGYMSICVKKISNTTDAVDLVGI